MVAYLSLHNLKLRRIFVVFIVVEVISVVKVALRAVGEVVAGSVRGKIDFVVGLVGPE